MAITIEDYIAQGVDDPMSYYGFSIGEKDGIIIFPVDNVIYDYLEELKSAAVEVELKADEFSKYIYKPWLLSYDLYENSELFFVILALNNMASPKEFNKSVIKMLSHTDMDTLMTQIYNSEESYLNKMTTRLE